MKQGTRSFITIAQRITYLMQDGRPRTETEIIREVGNGKKQGGMYYRLQRLVISGELKELPGTRPKQWVKP